MLLSYCKRWQQGPVGQTGDSSLHLVLRYYYWAISDLALSVSFLPYLLFSFTLLLCGYSHRPCPQGKSLHRVTKSTIETHFRIIWHSHAQSEV